MIARGRSLLLACQSAPPEGFEVGKHLKSHRYVAFGGSYCELVGLVYTPTGMSSVSSTG